MASDNRKIWLADLIISELDQVIFAIETRVSYLLEIGDRSDVERLRILRYNLIQWLREDLDDFTNGR